MFIRTVLLIIVSFFTGHQVMAEVVKFTPSEESFASPERGFYRGYTNNFATTQAEDLADLRSNKITTVYALIRLDKYRDGPVSEPVLQILDQKFALLRAAGVKAFVRAAYNYPENERDYLDAQDAPFSIVQTHISQLAPLVAKNRDVIVALEAGFIGAWGEGHTSSNKLDTVENKARVLSALLAAMPQDLPVLWRYPEDLIGWRAQKLKHVERVGLHNDCFLSSPTDVGTYSEERDVRHRQRQEAAVISASTFYVAETCGAEPRQIRSGCDSILNEGAEFHLSLLNRDYYETMLAAWEKQGCFQKIENSLGYRFSIRSARLNGQQLELAISNSGWARIVSSRALRLNWEGNEKGASAGNLREIAPGHSMPFIFDVGQAKGRFCLSAPDPAPSLAENSLYNVRFANFDNAPLQQSWDDAKGAFCFVVN